MWFPKTLPHEQIDAVDADVETSDTRRRDLGIPDGVWWLCSVIAGTVSGILIFVWLQPLGERPVSFVCASWVAAIGNFGFAPAMHLIDGWVARLACCRRALRILS